MIADVVPPVIRISSKTDGKANLDSIPRATKIVEPVPAWYAGLEQQIDSETVYPAESGYPTSDPTARSLAAVRTREIYDEFRAATPEPYFDSALDYGVDIYFEKGQNQMLLHVPPSGSDNYFCFRRVNGERSVERNPVLKRVVDILRDVVADDDV